MPRGAIVRPGSKRCTGKLSNWRQNKSARPRFFREIRCELHCLVMPKGQSTKWQKFSLKSFPLNLLVNCPRNANCGKAKMAVWTCLMPWDWPWCFVQRTEGLRLESSVSIRCNIFAGNAYSAVVKRATSRHPVEQESKRKRRTCRAAMQNVISPSTNEYCTSTQWRPWRI